LLQGVLKLKNNHCRPIPKVKIRVEAGQQPQTPYLRLTMFLENLQVPISVEIKLARTILFLSFIIAASLVVPGYSDAKNNSSECLSLVKPLDKKRKEAGHTGGVWGIFARESALDKHSKDAVKLDSQINKLVETLVYLCETKSGVPFNELASFVTRKIEEVGAEKFRQEQIQLGKPRQDVADWLKYSKVARANKKRFLELDKIKTSIQGARILINRYWKIFSEFRNKGNILPILPATIALNHDIENYMKSDPYMALAVFEDSQIPYWDIDENYGGS
jgi:hypothetical protein